MYWGKMCNLLFKGFLKIIHLARGWGGMGAKNRNNSIKGLLVERILRPLPASINYTVGVAWSIFTLWLLLLLQLFTIVYYYCYFDRIVQLYCGLYTISVRMPLAFPVSVDTLHTSRWPSMTNSLKFHKNLMYFKAQKCLRTKFTYK